MTYNLPFQANKKRTNDLTQVLYLQAIVGASYAHLKISHGYDVMPQLWLKAKTINPLKFESLHAVAYALRSLGEAWDRDPDVLFKKSLVPLCLMLLYIRPLGVVMFL